MEHKPLGRGLEALLKQGTSTLSAADRESVAKIAVDKIRPNRYQPRVHFSSESLQDLSASIKAHGLAQPLLVSPSAVPGEFELVAGERRLRASKMAGLSEVPCVVRAVSERQRHELSLVENIQREDLNAVEEAEALKKLMSEFSLTQEEVAHALGRSRSAVANKLRLLELPEDIRQAIMVGQLSEGHARTLLGIEERSRQTELSRRILREHLTVRDVEKIVADWQSAHHEGRVKTTKRKDPDVRQLEEDLQRTLGRKVEIQTRGKKKGWLRLAFYSLDDLQLLIRHLKKSKDGHSGRGA
ncbi:MAG TPA: ParB/RepB/Spo0J family partition protein [Elusimicrobiota bacterium]|nr:ParB/RepB/Spo0J family partition protein [Elusimicrobiota bacterium]